MVYLPGFDKDLWTNTQINELVALDRGEDYDMLSSWIIKFVRAWLHPVVGRHFKVSTLR